MKDVPLGWQLLFQLILILLNAVFACAEIAVITINDSKVTRLAAGGDKRAVRLAKLTRQPARFLSTIQVAITLSGFLGSAFAADNFAARITDWLIGLGVGMNPGTLNTLSVITVTIILSYFTLVLGELVPKRLAMKKAEKLALGMSGFISVMSVIFKPVVSLLTASTNGLLRLFGVDPNAEEEEATEEEIRMLVDVGSQKGTIDHSEMEWIQNVFEFDDISAGEISTHRTDLSFLWMEDDDEKWKKTIKESRHTLYPICGESVDDIVGILNTKDYFRLQDKSRQSVLENAVSPAYFVPESIKADTLFRSMKESRNHFAVVLDEYGGMVGVVTMNDLLEQLVGDLDDDDSVAVLPEIVPLGDHKWAFLGAVSLDDVEETLGMELPVDDYDTFGGFVLGTYGSIPEDGAHIEVDYENIQIREIIIKERRVVRAVVTLIPIEEPEDEEEKKGREKERHEESRDSA